MNDKRLFRLMTCIADTADLLPLLVRAVDSKVQMMEVGTTLRLAATKVLEACDAEEAVVSKGLRVSPEFFERGLQRLEAQVAHLQMWATGRRQFRMPLSDTEFFDWYREKPKEQKEELLSVPEWAGFGELGVLLVAGDIGAAGLSGLDLAKRLIAMLVAVMPEPAPGDPAWMHWARVIAEMLDRANRQMQAEAADAATLARVVGPDCHVAVFLTQGSMSGHSQATTYIIDLILDGKLSRVQGRIGPAAGQGANVQSVPFPGITQLLGRTVHKGKCGQTVSEVLTIKFSVPDENGQMVEKVQNVQLGGGDPCPFAQVQEFDVTNAAGNNPDVTVKLEFITIGLCA